MDELGADRNRIALPSLQVGRWQHLTRSWEARDLLVIRPDREASKMMVPLWDTLIMKDFNTIMPQQGAIMLIVIQYGALWAQGLGLDFRLEIASS